MYYLQTKASFDAAHFLWKYEGKCRNIHGHRWNIVAKIKSQKVLCDYFDHSLIYETGSLKAETVAALQNEDFHLEEVSFRPTAENFAYYFYKELTELGYEVHCVEVYETPNNCAVYEEE